MGSDELGTACPHCGHIYTTGSKFCPECGYDLINREVRGRKKRSGCFILLLFVLFLLVFLMVSGIGLRLIPAENLPLELKQAAAFVYPSITPTVTSTATALPPSPTATITLTATMIPTHTQTPPIPPVPAKTKETWVSPADGMELAYVPANIYQIGSLDSDTNALINEKPQHPVKLSAFWMDKTEVTNAMYSRCVLAGACDANRLKTSYTRESYFGDPAFDDYPVVYVSWFDAQKYCSWVGRRLPTEAQWEAAARGSDGRKYPWGNSNPGCTLTNFASRIDMRGGKSSLCVGDTSPVGKYPKGASPFGLLDMAGNVWEWTADWFGPNYLVEPKENPTGLADGTSRVIRGGFYFTDAKYVRATTRSWRDPNFKSNDIGFRCVRLVE